ncbi:thioredoxin family protein [Peribacillus deserti]|uniref:Thioredoxin family protein n=1 Tax=Peribacillus deserti TaxID=673318 RepID=A0A2N5M2X4_9BACI|nr:thioredoxin family protein [Peribacillus deserti]PLT28623.1 thioredoxin family protein [Peribacillus deserti]
MKSLSNWFDQAMSREEYINSMTVHRKNLQTVFQHFSLNEDDLAFLERVKEEKLKAVILTADWCGDAMVNLPIFMHIAEAAGIEDRYLIRDENLDLMDQYLTNGKSRSIPIIVLLNAEGEEAAKWGPRAPEAERQVSELKKDIPPKEDPGYEAAFKQFAAHLSQQFTEDKSLWTAIKNDMITTLKTR